MAIRIDQSLRRYIRENKEFIVQVQKSSDLEAATAALRRAAEDVAALDGGWESAFGLGPGDTNGPTRVGVAVAPSGPLLGVDGGHTPEEVLVTIPSLIVRRLEEAGVASAVVAVPRQSETLVHFARMPRAVVLCLYVPPPVCRRAELYRAWAEAKVPGFWLDEAYAWLTSGLSGDDHLWALIHHILEFSVRVSDVDEFFRAHGGLLVAGNPPSPAPSRQARAEGWPEEQRRTDSLERIGGRVRAVSGGGPHLMLAAGGSAATDDDLQDAFLQLRALAVRLAPTAAYAFVTFSPSFEIVGASALHLGWSRLAPQSSPTGICDVVAFDAFHAQILGPGHIRRMRHVPPGAKEVGSGRVELVVGDPPDWLPTTLRGRGLRLLAPCLISSYSERDRLLHQRYAASLGLSEVVVREAKRQLRYSDRPATSVEELLADPKMLIVFRHVASKRSSEPVPTRPVEAEYLTWTLPSGWRPLHDLERPVTLHLNAVPAKTIDDIVQFPDHVLESAGAWVAAGNPVKVHAWIGHEEFRVSAADVTKLLPLVARSAPEGRGANRSMVAALCEDGRVRMAVETRDAFAPGLLLMSGRQPDQGHPIWSTADDEALLEFDELMAFARSAAPDLGYACLSLDSLDAAPPIGVDTTPLCDEYVVDAFPYQILGPGHLQRLGSAPSGARSLSGGRVELSIGQPGDWLPRVRTAGRKLLAGCLVTENEAEAISRARYVAAALAGAGMPQALKNLTCSGGDLDALPGARRAVVARLDVAPEGNGSLNLPGEWIEAAAAWVSGDLGPDAPLLAAVEHGMQFPLPPADATAFFVQCAENRACSAVLAAGDVGGTIRAASVTGDTQYTRPQIALALGGPDSTDDDLLAAFEALRGVARHLAPRAAYASIDFQPNFSTFWGGVGGTSSDHRPFTHDWQATVPDAFAFQILGPEQLVRLGARPEGARDLGAGRLELAIGEPDDWLLQGTQRDEVQRQAREKLSILLAPSPT